MHVHPVHPPCVRACACFGFGSRFAFACSKLEFENRGNFAFKLHKFGFNILKVVFDCVDHA